MTDPAVGWELFRPGAGLPLLVDALLKGTLLLLAAFLLTSLLRRAAAALRHLLWSVALAGLLALPVVGALSPWELAVLPAVPGLSRVSTGTGAPSARPGAEGGAARSGAEGGVASLPEPPTAGPAGLGMVPARQRAPYPFAGGEAAFRLPPGRDPGVAGGAEEAASAGGVRTDGSPARSSPAGGGAEPLDEVGRPPAGGAEPLPEAGWPPAGGIPWPSLPDLLVGIWLLGFAVFVAQWLAAVVVMRRIVSRASPVGPEGRAELEGAARRMGLRSPVSVRTSHEVPVPLAFGLLRPLVVLPAVAAEWTAARRRTVLLHELAHLRRGDLLTHAAARLACALFWPHPLAWLAARRHRSEAERACDDLVLGQGVRPSEYAGDLIDIVRSAGRARAPAASVPMARRSEFEGRLMAILEPGLRRGSLRPSRTAPVVGIGGLLLLPLAALAPSPSAPATEAVAEPGRAAELLAGSTVDPAATMAAPAPTALESGFRLDHAHPEPDRGQSGKPAPSTAPDADRDLERSADLEVATRTGAQLERKVGVKRESSTASASPSLRVESKPPEKSREAKESEVQESAARRSRIIVSLSSALRDPDAGVRAAAAGALADLEDPSTAEALSSALRDVSPEVRAIAAGGLGSLEDPRAVEALMRVLRGDEDAGVRQAAAEALGEIGDRRAVPALVEALRDESPGVRREAAWALGQLEDPRATEGLVRAIPDEDPEVRSAVVEALGEIADPRAAEGLARALADASAEVRKEAAWALGELKLTAAPPALKGALEDPNPEVREHAAHTLGHIGDPAAVPWLRARLRDESRDVRIEAVEALTEIGGASAIEALIEAMRDPDAEVRKEAAEALGRGGKR